MGIQNFYDMKEKRPYVLVACECSQIVCAAFRQAGYAAYSNDIVNCYGGHPEWHIMCDARQVVKGRGCFRLENGEFLDMLGFWDLIIAHPPCTMLTHSSASALASGKHTMEDVETGAAFFMDMLNAPAYYIAVENPAPMRVAGLPEYNQIVHPYMFGQPFSKRVCLWLKNLPQLLETGPWCYDHKSWLKHCANNPRRRSYFWTGIAQAMAAQWGDYVERSVK